MYATDVLQSFSFETAQWYTNFVQLTIYARSFKQYLHWGYSLLKCSVSVFLNSSTITMLPWKTSVQTSRPLQNNSPSSTNVTEVTASEKLIRSRIRIVNLFNSRQEHIQVFIGLSPLITKQRSTRYYRPPTKLWVGTCNVLVVFLSVCSHWAPHVTSIHNAIGQ